MCVLRKGLGTWTMPDDPEGQWEYSHPVSAASGGRGPGTEVINMQVPDKYLVPNTQPYSYWELEPRMSHS